MAVYGITAYGTEFYGYDTPPQYLVEPFYAWSVNYNSIALSWNKPAGTIQAYRLIRNRYGFPVDQDDGEILIDSLSYPGSSYLDQSVIPGDFHYYSFFILLDFEGDRWTCAGMTACLAVDCQYDSGDWLYDLVPLYYKNAVRVGGAVDVDLTDPVGNIYLNQFMNVFAWGLDLIRTQYGTYLNVNNPWAIPYADLCQLAAELGIDIIAGIHPYTLRKAVYYNAAINEQRGTLTGIAMQVAAITGWDLDLQVGQNMMLENDQSEFLDPVPLPWSAGLAYNVGETVQYENYIYECIISGGIGVSPTGTAFSNTYWNPVLNFYTTDGILTNQDTLYPNTWEVLYPDQVNAQPSAGSIGEIQGVSQPLNPSNFVWNNLQIVNQSAITQPLWVRSVSRTPADMNTITATFAPDQMQAIGDGIPVPWSNLTQSWDAATYYHTGDIVTLSNQPFIALRASTGATPPYSGSATPEWAPLSIEPRYRLCLSEYTLGSEAVAVTPFCEWYDNQGNLISRIMSRTQFPGSEDPPNNLAFDSFTTFSGDTIDSRGTDDGENTWAVGAGDFSLATFAGGTAYPAVTGTRSYATINGQSNCQVGVTFVTPAEAGQTQALMLRATDGQHYLRADMSALKMNNGGTWTTLGTYSTGFSQGDRMVVQLNGVTVTVLRNGVPVLEVITSFNEFATMHGILVEND